MYRISLDSEQLVYIFSEIREIINVKVTTQMLSLLQLELSLNMIISPTSTLSQSKFWSKNGEWFSKGSSGQNCVDGHENCICTTS